MAVVTTVVLHVEIGHRRAADAWERGALAEEVVPFPLPPEYERFLERDNAVLSDATTESLGRLEPRFVPDFGVGEDFEWADRELYWTYGQGRMAYLGRGIMGRFQLSRLFFQQKDWTRARREIEFLLSRYPDDPDRLYDLGALALAEGKGEEAQRVLTRLTEMAAAEAEPGRATNALEDFRRQIQSQGRQGAGAP